MLWYSCASVGASRALAVPAHLFGHLKPSAQTPGVSSVTASVPAQGYHMRGARPPLTTRGWGHRPAAPLERVYAPHCIFVADARTQKTQSAQHSAAAGRLKFHPAAGTRARRPRAVRCVTVDYESPASRLSHAPASVGYESPHDSHGAPRGRREAIAYLSVPSTAASTRTRSRRRSSSISRSSSFADTDCSSSTRTTASFGTALHGSSP